MIPRFKSFSSHRIIKTKFHKSGSICNNLDNIDWEVDSLLKQESSLALDRKNHVDEIVPHDIWTLPERAVNLIAGYAWDTPLQKPFLFSNIDYTLEKILFLAEHAGPLDQFETYVKKFIKNELTKKVDKFTLLDTIFTLGDRQGTLIECLVIGGDQTIRDSAASEIDEGMAEKFIAIINDLLPPDRFEQVKEQARKAAPLENEKTREERESRNIAALEPLFEAFKQSDEKIIQQAIETFKDFVNNIKRRSMNNNGYLTDNQYYVNVIHLIYKAFYILQMRGGELPPVSLQDKGCWDGIRINRFCFEIIGAILQIDLPPRLRQLLKTGLRFVYNLDFNIKADRNTYDISHDFFRGVGTEHLLGLNSYYGETLKFSYSRSTGVDGFKKLLGTIADSTQSGIYRSSYRHWVNPGVD